MRNVTLFVLLVFFVAIASSDAFPQSPEAGHKYQQKVAPRFEIVSIENAHFTTTQNCFGFKVISIFVPPEIANETKVRAFGKHLASTFPLEYDLIMIFVSDRKYSEIVNFDEDSEEEKDYLRALRGIYFRRHERKLEQFYVFTNGTSSPEFDLLFPEN